MKPVVERLLIRRLAGSIPSKELSLARREGAEEKVELYETALGLSV